MIKFDMRKKQLEPHGNKKIRVNASLDQDTHNKLKKLSVSCDMTKTMMAYEIIKIVVNHTDFIDWLQDKYNKEQQYRVVPIRKDGKTFY
ncbi:nuclear transport factor 2 (NTF2) superfamily protein [Bacillus ectoiniformans]|uniref:hypothetical protein n=1 Tax=Bacillus ectoiniformans TaxID=1494429 RepID=UPI001EF90CAB|nr:hypothetical protein [Bacillus ectoiniformans]MBM7650533.1 nuclear transport factor 2 (NTF2) superfamily protein [Bacillus ectoiniformans]